EEQPDWIPLFGHINYLFWLSVLLFASRFFLALSWHKSDARLSFLAEENRIRILANKYQTCVIN
ncbi:MAG: hypothetical protein ACPGLY_26005, partial [Rubripirellula sp.]